MEAEADRQSVSFLMIFIDEVMGPDGRGTYLRFASHVMVNELIVYALTILTILLQQLTAGVRSTRPSPNERQYILYSSMASYISKVRPIEAGVVTPKIFLWGMEAAKKLGLRNAGEPDMLLDTALKMGEIDRVITEHIRIRRHYCNCFELYRFGVVSKGITLYIFLLESARY